VRSVALACSLAAILAISAFGQVTTATKKYTTTADFNLGTIFNLDTSTPDQLQISAVTTTFNVMWVAHAGEDTISKVDTTNGRELARYKTWFTGSGPYPTHLGNPYAGGAPSRTAVDSEGNVYVANRHFDGRSPVVIKILSNTFIDRNGNGTADTSSDANNNGTISGAELLPLVDADLDGVIDPNEIQDERRLGDSAAKLRGQCTRPLSVD